MSVAMLNARCSAISAPWSQVSVLRSASGIRVDGVDQAVANGVGTAFAAQVAEHHEAAGPLDERRDR